MANKRSISRQELLKSIFEKVAHEKEMRLELIIEKNIHVMEEMTDAINRLENLLVDLMGD